jgi:hypothetical protein
MLDGILEAKKSIEEMGIKFVIEKVDDIKQRVVEISRDAFALISFIEGSTNMWRTNWIYRSMRWNPTFAFPLR